ncbi:MAG: FHA domain-containing protein [Pegethrix bostrychoides GSE-TBD4-15B]|jgi:ferredoxin-NADP reductase|uniref:Ferredoxin--NADP reductase n=1 Tax=Pegethrix bostrychoides GSE-TBD4-15B TaxID=2839662 RepID=A0A951U7R3_9CYAN|nr:FHA domain-containing protein [Pegethrix bostrychoides GSE-TBD4-15B]
MLKTKVLNPQTHQFYETVLIPNPGSPSECLIGRHASCDLVLDSPEISRVHCRVLFWKGQCYFADLGSTDGSRLNNESVQVNRHYPLKPEDTIRIGDFLLLVEAIDLPQQTALDQPAEASSLRPVWSDAAGGEIVVRCVQIIQQTHDVKTFRFVAEPAVLFSHRPGQFVTLSLEIDGQPVQRSYSISSSPSRPETLDITVKRVVAPPDSPTAAPGLVSNWLHDHLSVGRKLRLNGPFGSFTCLDAPAPKLLLLSAGSGITPMISMTQWLCDTASDLDVIFLHSARSPQDLIFRQQLEALAAQHPNLKLAVTLTRSSHGQAWLGYSGHLSSAMLQSIAPDLQERWVYVCGPAAFMDAAKTLLAELKFPMQHYFAESFGAAKPRSQPSLTQPRDSAALPIPDLDRHHSPELKPDLKIVPSIAPASRSDARTSILFTKSGKEVACEAEDCILEIAEQENIRMPSGCRVGVCGVCKHRVIDGEVTYAEAPAALQAAELQQGFILPCVAYPVGRVVLEA